MSTSNIRHFVCLEGQGDSTISLVTAQQFEWINSNPPANYLDLGSWTEKDPEDGHEVEITCGSYDNDRALQVTGTEFGSIKAAMDFAAKNGLEISEDEYHGHIY